MSAKAHGLLHMTGALCECVCEPRLLAGRVDWKSGGRCCALAAQEWNGGGERCFLRPQRLRISIIAGKQAGQLASKWRFLAARGWEAGERRVVANATHANQCASIIEEDRGNCGDPNGGAVKRMRFLLGADAFSMPLRKRG